MQFSIFPLAVLFILLATNVSASNCIDTGVQGDGWGWDGYKSCQIPITPGECVDHDGDGWGWDGVDTCLAHDETTSNNDALFAVLPTGQTISYVNGDDADWQISTTSESRFTDNADGTFGDNLTGLTWLSVRQCIFEQTWSSAISYVNQLSAGVSFCTELNDGSAIGDWRLPNINELQSLVNYGKHSPVFEAGIPFTGTWDNFPWGRYWSSTSFNADPAVNAWILNADFGQVGIQNKTSVARVFAVRN